MDGNEVRDILATNVKTLRRHRNWTQADLAEKSGLSIVYLSDIERGNKWPYLDTLVKLADVFKVDVYELVKPENVPPPTATKIIKKYTEEMTDIMVKTFKTTEKNTLKSIITLQRKYIKE